MVKHQNILSEIKWSIFHHDWSPGFEDILNEGVNSGWYDMNNVLERLVFWWLAIPWIQAEIDDWMDHRNQSKPHADKNKILPHRIPDIIRVKPQNYRSFDFKVIVPPKLFDEVEQQYAPMDHLIFELVPPAFNDHANILYAGIGQPVVQLDTFWDVYCQLVQQFYIEEYAAEVAPILETHHNTVRILEAEEEMPLLPNLKGLCNGANVVGPPNAKYIGGMVNNPPVGGLWPEIKMQVENKLDESDESDNGIGSDRGVITRPQYAKFMSDEDEEDDDDGEDKADDL